MKLHDSYDVNMLVNRLNNMGKKITPDDVIKYGLDGVIQFVVEDPNFGSTTLTRFRPKPLTSPIRLANKYPFEFSNKDKDRWCFEYVCEADRCITTLPAITPHQLASIMQSNLSEPSTDKNTHFELTVVSTIGEFNVEQQYLSTPRRFYSKENLRITKDEVLRLDKEYFWDEEEEANNKKTKQHRREKIVERYLERNNRQYIEPLSLQAVWRQLSLLEPELFQEAEDRTIGDCFTQCRKAGIDFPFLSHAQK